MARRGGRSGRKKTRDGTAKAPLSTHGSRGINAPVRVHRPGECSRASRMHLRMQCLAPVSSSSTPFPWRGSTLPSVLPLFLFLSRSASLPPTLDLGVSACIAPSLSVLPIATDFSPFSASCTRCSLILSLPSLRAHGRSLSRSSLRLFCRARPDSRIYPTTLLIPVPFRTFTFAGAKPYVLHPKNNPRRNVSYDLYTAYVK